MTYDESINHILAILKSMKFCTLASANKQGEISASQVCLVNDGLTVFVQTDKTFEKVKNISENPNVALNCGALYFKGTAKIIGHPTTNKYFVEAIKQKHPETYKHYSNLPNEVLIEIKLTEARIWGVDSSKDIHNQEKIVVINLTNKTITEIICDKL